VSASPENGPASSPTLPPPGREGEPVRRIVLGLIAFLTLQVLALTLDTLFPPDLSRGERSSPVVLDRKGAWLRALPVEDGRWRIRADLTRTDKTFQ